MTDSKLSDVISENMDDEKNVNKIETTPETKEPETPPKEEPQEDLLKVPEKVETKKLSPDELENIRSEWNKKYTQTRQKEKEELRNWEAKVKDYEEKLKKLESVPVQTPNIQQEKKEVQEQFDLGNLSLEQYTARLRALNAEDARQIAREEFGTLISKREDDTNQQNMLVEFNRLDERFDAKYTDPDSPEYNETDAWLYRQVASQMGTALNEHIAQTGSSKGFDTKGKASEFIKQFDNYADSVVKSRVQQTTTHAQVRAQQTAKSTPRGTTSPSISTQSRDLRTIIESKVSD